MFLVVSNPPPPPYPAGVLTPREGDCTHWSDPMPFLFSDTFRSNPPDQKEGICSISAPCSELLVDLILLLPHPTAFLMPTEIFIPPLSCEHKSHEWALIEKTVPLKRKKWLRSLKEEKHFCLQNSIHCYGFFKNIIPAASLVNCLYQMHASQFETGKVLLKAISFTNILIYDEPLEQWLRSQGFIHGVLVCLVAMFYKLA